MSRALRATWIFIFLISLPAMATITVSDVVGAFSGSIVTATEVSIFQSTQGTACTTSSDTEVCNACTATTVAVGNYCSTRYAPSANYFTINFISTAAGTLKVSKSDDSVDLNLNGSNPTVAANTSHSVKLRWSDIETNIWGTLNAGTIKLKVDTAFVSISVKRQAAVTGGADSDCTTTINGACDFRLFPGDEKAYLELDIENGYPTNTEGLDFAGVRVYYKEISQADTTTNCPRVPTAACGITFNYNDGEFIDVNIDSQKTFEDSLSNLQNDKYYCFQVVNRTVGNDLGYGLNINSTASKKCVSAAPSEVVGLLTETNNCFIATAAYGSPFQSKVKTLREFRDKILLPYELGRKFVKWYYSVGPAWAKKIQGNETAKFTVRVLLWPIWLLSWIVLKFSFATLFVLLVPALFYMFRNNKSTAAGIILALTFSSAPANAQDLEEEESAPPQEAPFTPPQEEVKAASKAQTLPPVVAADDAKTEQRVENLKKNIEAEMAQVQRDNEKIDKLQAELDKLNDINRRRRLNIGSKNEKILDLESKQRLLKNPPRMSKRTGEIQYPRRETPQTYGGSFRIGNYSPAQLENPDNGVTFDEVYKDSADIIVLFDFEYQFFKGLGKAGLKFGTGIFSASGKGRFKNSPQTEARETFTFLMMPNVAGGVYRMQLWEKQILVPYVEGGGGYFTFIELRDDFKRTKYGGSFVGYWAAGGQLLLDFLSPTTMGELDSDYGINHMWLTAEFRSYLGGGDLDFSSDSFNAGIFFEF